MLQVSRAKPANPASSVYSENCLHAKKNTSYTVPDIPVLRTASKAYAELK